MTNPTNHNNPIPSFPSLNEHTPPDSLTPLHDLVSASRLIPYQTNLSRVTPQPVRWLWQNLIPFAGITLLDGDHDCGKSLLALQLAAIASTGALMPDLTPTKIQGGVVLITSHTDPTTTQLQRLKEMGANLDCIKILSSVPQPAPPSNPIAPDAHPTQCVDDKACPVVSLADASHVTNASTTLQMQCVDDGACPIAPPADASHVKDPSTSSHTNKTSEPLSSRSRPFCLPEDLNLLIQTIERINARLVIFDPFISLLSRTRRITNERLGHLLADLNLYFIEHNIACLLIRNCPARGGHARPSVLERSDHFLITAVSRLLLTPDPFLPDRILLCQAINRHAALHSTLILQIQPYPHHSELARFTFLDTHTLRARDFIENRPDTLHRKFLFQHLLQLIHEPANFLPFSNLVHVSNLYAQCPNSSPYQVQRSLNDLLNMGQIERPNRGLYTLASTPLIPEPANQFNTPATTTRPTPPTTQLNTPAATTPTPEPTTQLNAPSATPYPPDRISNLNIPAAITQPTPPTTQLNTPAATTHSTTSTNQLNTLTATTPTPEPTTQLNATGAITPPHIVSSTLNFTAATPPSPNQTCNLNAPAATPSALESPNQLNATAAITSPHIVSSMLNATCATPPIPQPPNQPNAPAATTFIPNPELTKHLSPADAKLYNQVMEANWRMTYMDEPRDIAHSQEMQRRKDFWNTDYGD